MIEDAINRLAAAIEAHTAAIIDSRRQLAEVGTTAKPEPKPEPKPKPKNNPKTEPEPEPVLGTRAISRKDLTEFAMSLSRQDTAYGAKIKAALAKYSAPTISALAEDKIGAVFADLNNMAHADAREPGEEG